MEKIKILLIEDESLFRTAVRIVLTRRGYEILEAADGEEGMQIIIGGNLEESGVRLILLDLMMPKISGIDILEYLIEAKIDVPVLVMTSMLDFDIRFFCSRIKKICVLQKPFSSKEFFEKVNEMLCSGCKVGGEK